MDAPRRPAPTSIRRTRLKRSTKPIRRSTPKRAREKSQYSRKCAAYKRKHPWCAACEALSRFNPMPVGICRTSDVHHKMGREGDLLLDERFWMPVCRTCHDWIEDHGREARRLGFVLDKDYRN
jgi:hypothetical protein